MNSSENTGPAWYAVYTKSRAERAVREQLARRSVESFLPERWVWSRRRDRRKPMLTPLFPGYLFVRTRLAGNLHHAVLRTPGVVSMLGWDAGGWRPRAVPDSEVESLKILVASQLALKPMPYLANGDRVIVLKGPLAGARGLVLRRGQGARLLVSVELMQRSVAVDLDESVLEKAEAA